jgi:hypothetical protein
VHANVAEQNTKGTKRIANLEVKDELAGVYRKEKFISFYQNDLNNKWPEIEKN